MNIINPDAQRIIDSLAAHQWKRCNIDRSAIESAITQHLTELGLPPQPFVWCEKARDGYAAAESAAWSAAETNALAAFNHPAQAKLAAIWLPMEKAFRNGLSGMYEIRIGREYDPYAEIARQQAD